MPSPSKRLPTLNILIPHERIHRYSKQLLQLFRTVQETPEEEFTAREISPTQASNLPERIVCNFVKRVKEVYSPVQLFLYPTILVIRVLPTRFILTNGRSILLRSRNWFLPKTQPPSVIRPTAASTQADVANAIMRLSSTLRDFSIPARGHEFHEILSKSSILCEDLKALLREEKEYTKWKLIQHEEIDERLQPLHDAVEDVKNGFHELTPEYEMAYTIIKEELEDWINHLQEAQVRFENHMGMKYGLLGCRIYVVQAKVDLLLELEKSNSRAIATRPCIKIIEGSTLYLLGHDMESMGEEKEEAINDEDGTQPPPDSPPAKSFLENFPIVSTPESASGNTPLVHRPRQRGRSRTSKGSNRSSSLTAYQRSSGKPYAKRPSISPRSSLLRSKLEAEEKNKGTQRVPSQSSASSSQTEHPSDDLSDATAYSDNTQYEVEESSKYSETSELAQALEGFVNDMDELNSQRDWFSRQISSRKI